MLRRRQRRKWRGYRVDFAFPRSPDSPNVRFLGAYSEEEAMKAVIHAFALKNQVVENVSVTRL
jgi:hypothetical protein